MSFSCRGLRLWLGKTIEVSGCTRFDTPAHWRYGWRGCGAGCARPRSLRPEQLRSQHNEHGHDPSDWNDQGDEEEGCRNAKSDVHQRRSLTSEVAHGARLCEIGSALRAGCCQHAWLVRSRMVAPSACRRLAHLTAPPAQKEHCPRRDRHGHEQDEDDQTHGERKIPEGMLLL